MINDISFILFNLLFANILKTLKQFTLFSGAIKIKLKPDQDNNFSYCLNVKTF